MANSVPDKKGWIIFSDAVTSRVRAGTLSEGVPEPQVTGRQTNTRWQPFVTNYETPSAVVGRGDLLQQVRAIVEPLFCVNSRQPSDSPKAKPVCALLSICLPHSQTQSLEYQYLSRSENVQIHLSINILTWTTEFRQTIFWSKSGPELN